MTIYKNSDEIVEKIEKQIPVDYSNRFTMYNMSLSSQYRYNNQLKNCFKIFVQISIFL